MQAQDEKLLTPRETAEFLAIGLRSLQRHTAAGAVPQPVKFGRTVRYSRQAIQRWISNRGSVIAT
jgi:excisionase family DNA binding protein